jgi:hypothetical protein
MRVYYQVCASYSFRAGKASLSGLSLHSTSEYFPFLVGSYTSLSNSMYFRTLAQAQQYISYLLSRYPKSAVARPVLDPQQLLLF